MGKDPERRLRERLARVEALHAGATTEGERLAADKARIKVLERLVAVRAEDEVARFCAAHVASLGVEDRPAEPAAALPSPDRLRGRLLAWAHGDLSCRGLRRWATRVCDRVVIPPDPTHPDAVLGEILLALASLHRVRLAPGDVPAILAFLADGDWAAWFSLLERAAHRRAG